MSWWVFLRRLLIQEASSNQIKDLFFFGLGNPGEQYKYTRHNIGFRILDSFRDQLLDHKKVTFPEAEFIRGKLVKGESVAIIKPLSFMNNSGPTIAAILKKYRITKDRFLIIVDDIHIPFGYIRIRRKGSDGGHNGLKSIIQQIGPNFARLRVGIGPLPKDCKTVDHVLGNFTTFEEHLLVGIIAKTNEILKSFTVQTIDSVMNLYNTNPALCETSTPGH